MLPNPSPTDADRIALHKMFKAIAEYGRKVRLRRQSDGGAPIKETLDQLAQENKNLAAHRRKYRRRKVAP